MLNTAKQYAKHHQNKTNKTSSNQNQKKKKQSFKFSQESNQQQESFSFTSQNKFMNVPPIQKSYYQQSINKSNFLKQTQIIDYDKMAIQNVKKLYFCQCIGTWNQCQLLKELILKEKILTQQIYLQIKDSSSIRLDQQKIMRKDIPRINPEIPSFFFPLIQIVCRCTISYLKLQYVQGMANVIGYIVCHLKNDYKSWIFSVKLFSKIRFIYQNNFNNLGPINKSIQKLMKQNLKKLYQHFIMQNINTQMIINKWCLSMMTNTVPIKYISIFFYGLINQGFQVFNGLVLLILKSLENNLIKSQSSIIYEQLLTHKKQSFPFKWLGMINLAIQLKLQ